MSLFQVIQPNALYDYVIVAGVTSKPHLQALEGCCRRELKEWGFELTKPTEGRTSSSWRVVDGGFLVIHLMTQEARKRYNLENVWSNGKTVAFAKNKKTVKKRARVLV